MYNALAHKLAVTLGTAAYSRAVSLAGTNQVLFQAVYVATGASPAPGLKVTLEEGNDLQNWSAVLTLSLSSVGFDAEQTVSGIASQYVRLKYELNGGSAGDVVVASAGMHVADL